MKGITYLLHKFKAKTFTLEWSLTITLVHKQKLITKEAASKPFISLKHWVLMNK